MSPHATLVRCLALTPLPTTFLTLVLTSVLACCLAASDLDPARAPGQNFDLSHWKLTLPVDAFDSTSGVAREVKPISTTFIYSPWFVTRGDGAMEFSAPTTGATTSGSHYPRCELREMTAAYANAAWTVADRGAMAARLAVEEVPTTSTGQPGRVVIGQIHGPNDELCRLYYDNGQLYFYDDKAGSAQVETKFILRDSNGAETSIPLGARFDYQIFADASSLQVTADHNGIHYTVSDPISAFWPGKQLYFKAGVYLQVGAPGSSAGTTGTGQGRVSFYSLAFTHADENLAPVVDAGPNRAGSTSVPIALSGSVTDDGKPVAGSLGSQWTMVSGPGSVAFATASDPATTATFTVAGTYVLRLTADDGAANRADDVIVTVSASTPPVTAAPVIGTTSNTGTATPTLNGTAATNATVRVYDGGVLIATLSSSTAGAWTWTANPPLSVGTHSLTVTAQVVGGTESTSSAVVTVTAPSPGATNGATASRCGLGLGLGLFVGLLAMMCWRPAKAPRCDACDVCP